MISKRKFHADPRAVRSLKEAVDRGDWVGLYPEGEASWHGQLVSLIPGTGKLLKFLGAPVVCVITEGAYFAQGRWLAAKGFRPVSLKITRVFQPQDIRALDPEALEAELRRALEDDPWTHPQVQSARFEGIEAALAYCPACGSYHRIEGRRFSVRCTACGAICRLDPAPERAGNLVWTTNPGRSWKAIEPLPDRMRGWFEAQDRAFGRDGYRVWAGHGALARFEVHSPTKGRMYARSALVEWASESPVLRVRNAKSLESILELPIQELRGMNVQMGERLEFRWKDRIYLLRFQKPFGGYPFYRWWSGLHKLSGTLQGKSQNTKSEVQQ